MAAVFSPERHAHPEGRPVNIIELAEQTAAKVAADIANGGDGIVTIHFALLEAQELILADTMQKLANPPRTVKFDA